jgi:hypothetical protein
MVIYLISDLDEDTDEENAPRCVTCDEPIVDEPTYRVVTWIEDGEPQTEHFCDEAC